MAGLIDVGIIKPELAGAFGAGYRGAEQERQKAAQTAQQMQFDAMKLQQLQQDRQMMLDLQSRLKAAGQDPDLDKVFDALIATGNPDYVMKGTEGKQRLREQREFARITGGFGGAAPAAPAAAPALQPGAGVSTPPASVIRVPQPSPFAAPPAPTNVLGAGLFGVPEIGAPVNALAARPTAAAPGAPGAVTAGPNAALITQTQDRINALMRFASTASPQMANNALAQARVLQDQLELYSRPERAGAAKPASLQELEAYMAMTPEQKAAFEKLQKIKQPNVSATATTSPTGKSLSAPVGQRAETSLVKAEGAAGIMENANLVREALNTGNVIAGPLAGVRTKFAQVLELAGAGDKEKLVNTRTAIQGLAALTLESRAELKGQGQITENEQKLLERARSGNIEDMTIAELQQIVNISQRLATRMWTSHEKLLKTMETDPAAADSIRYYRPTVTLPQAVGEGKPQAEADKRRQNLSTILGGKKE